MGDLYTKRQAKAGSVKRGLSPNLWGQVNLTEINNGGISEGFGFLDDFVSNAGHFLLAQDGSQGAIEMAPAEKGGALLIDSAGTDDNEGPDSQLGGTQGGASFIASADSKIYYEARIKITDTAVTSQYFLGLGAVLAPFIDSDANVCPNHVGFEGFSSLSSTFAVEKAGSRSGSTTASAATLVEDTYIKLGFEIDGLTKITPYVDGQAGAVITTNIPIVGMTPTFAVRSTNVGTDPIMSVDWIACYQVEQIAN